MEKQPLILITGAAGFIGSCVVQLFNEQGRENIVLVDKFTDLQKERNWKDKKYKYLVDRELLLEWLDENKPNIEFIIHLGARTNVREKSNTVLQEMNVEYSEDVWNYATVYNIPLVYASSATTYGNGELGFNDDDKLIGDFQPLNEYAASKHNFDKWAVQQLNAPPYWAGLKLFNVYGPNEYHKGEGCSIVLKTFKQIQENNTVTLFKSNSESFEDGGQLRDFIYVKDVAKLIWWMYNAMIEKQWPPEKNGLYNVGTGKARSFKDVAILVFKALGKEPNIIYTEMPEDIASGFRGFSEATTVKLKHAGYNEPFTSLEEGIEDYIKNYLAERPA
ncbi:ADP-glyceromanno-heptose 6-epimerase [Parafilimonas sp.]|uniref:ADP-glyceromanno-heptose 6-epimerase n=1 Tax=Parafilimonas sp. TaxID=1969739 RepID=UPI003F808806